ncbi:LysR family transcriptional regulator [uncultured Herbaspirillum sp.]|uniref:LysR family transcriptional regulator n=1 Tax=uncultured Herbaspirillum sp. TaxID=160236 RepID=UPI0025885C46|nr:LysR family transcriptional regulator [uncultured Herbaspirillum sp.]
MDRFVSMTIFTRVVERGSFSAAAEGSGMTATMVGNHIRALEELLGARLLNRTTRRQSLTETGRNYYEQCVNILAQVQAAEADARDVRERPRGRLRVSVPVMYGTMLLVPAIGEYLDANSDVQVELALSDRFVDLADEGFEAAIRIGILPDSNLIARPLGHSSLVACASPEYLERHGMPATPKDLEKHQCIAIGFASGVKRDWRFNLVDDSEEIVRVPGRLDISGSGIALREAALAGLGIIFQPEMIVKQDIAAGRLIRLFSDLPSPSNPVHLVYLSERKLTAKLSSFINFMVGRFGTPNAMGGIEPSTY